MEESSKMAQLHVLKRLTRNALRTDGTPMPRYEPLAWAASTSWRDGELRTCMKKLDDANTAVDTTLRNRCSPTFNFAALPPSHVPEKNM